MILSSMKMVLASSRRLRKKHNWSDKLTSPLAVVLTVSACLFQNRRWSSAQAREFLHLHSTLALITLHSDLTPQQTHGETHSRFSLIQWFYMFRLSLLLSFSVQHREDSNYK